MPISNYLPSSRLFQAGVCTSSTRPSAPYEGQVIYETDTDETLVYNGTTWATFVVTSDDEGISTTGTITAGSDITASGTAAASGVSVIARNSSTNGYSQLLAGSTLQGGAGIWRNGTANSGYGGASSLNIGTVNADPFTICTGNTVRMTVSPAGVVAKPYQPYVQARGNGGVWVIPWGVNATIRNNFNGTAFTWSMAQNVGSHFDPSSGFFTAPVSGVYLCIFKTYQQNYGGNGYIHWMFNVGGTAAWNNGSTPYNIYGYDKTAYADGIDVSAMIYISAGTGVGIEGHYGGDERFYSDYTYFSVYFLG